MIYSLSSNCGSQLLLSLWHPLLMSYPPACPSSRLFFCVFRRKEEEEDECCLLLPPSLESECRFFSGTVPGLDR